MKFNTRASRNTEPRSLSQLSQPEGSPPLVSEQTVPPPDAPQQNKGTLMLSMMEELQRELQEARSEIGGLRNDFQAVVTEQGVQHKIFDALHTELSDYKNDFVSARMKPMLSAMLFLGDALAGFYGELDAYVDPPDWLGDKVLKKALIESNLTYFQEQLDEILRMCELQPVTPEVGALVDMKANNVTAAASTDDVTMHNRIQKVIRLGWMQGDKMFRPAEVVVWKAAS